MSEYLTHVAIADDTRRLALHSADVCRPFQQALRRHSEVVRMGALSRWGDPLTVEGFAHLRQRWPDGDAPKQLAYFIGWRAHNAADRFWKPRHREINADYYAAQAAGEAVRPPSDARIYNDLIVFHEVYRSGTVEPTGPALYDLTMQAHPAGRAVAGERLDSLMLGVFQRTLIPLQSWSDEEDFDVWYEKFNERFQTFRIPLDRYAEVFRTPDPVYMRRFVLDNNFYDRDDALIRLARSIQDGRADGSIALDEAVAAAAAQSEYAQTLRKSYLYTKAASAFFEEWIDEEEFSRRLDLDKAHDTGRARQ